MKWLIFGSKGWIAGHVMDCLESLSEKQDIVKVTEACHTKHDIENIILRENPDLIVCCVGRTYGPGFTTIDYLEQKGKLAENLESNLLIPIWLATSTSLPILYFGTGCIYEYDETHSLDNKTPFRETDEPNFTGSAYSTVKGATDKLMSAFPHVINARIRMPISKDWHPRDFVTKIMGYKKITSIPNSMSVLEDIIPRLLALLYDHRPVSTVNAVNPGYIDHEALLTMFERPKDSYTLESTEQQNTHLLSRRSNNILSADYFQKQCEQIRDSTRKLFKIETVAIPQLEDSLKSIQEYRKNNKRALLVTGGYGFIASNFINYWLKKYPMDTIVNVDRLDTCSNRKNVDQPGKNYQEYILDIENGVKMLEILKRHSITHVLHFAAETHVDNSFGNPLSFTRSNVLGTHSLLEAVKAYGQIKCFYHMSTDEVYGEVHEGEAKEESLLFPTNPYAATKAAAEYIVHSYGRSFKLPYVIMRANNIYGPNQYPEKVIPAFTTSLLNGSKLKIQGDGSAKRMFLHVLDLASAVECIFFKGKVGETYNIGTNEEYTVKEIAKFLIRTIKNTENIDEFIDYVPDRPFNDSRYSIDSSKVIALGWNKKYTFESSIKEIIEWYRTHSNYWSNHS